MPSNNYDDSTIDSFGDEWSRFNQSGLSFNETETLFYKYFSIFPWHSLPDHPQGFDMGCGSGRWAKLVAPRVGLLNCIDPSSALDIAAKNLNGLSNINLISGTVTSPGLQPNSQDFGYSLGVLHHIPDTAEALRCCVDLLKPGAPFLLYLYYSLDNRPIWFRFLWLLSNYLRLFISHLPFPIINVLTDILAVFVYYPLSRIARLFELFGFDVSHFPLSYYRKSSLYVLRTDSRDRFGTPLEHRFSKREISDMCDSAGLSNLVFSNREPYWTVVGFKRS